MTKRQLKLAIAKALGWHIKITPGGTVNDGRHSGALYNGNGEPYGFLWIGPKDKLHHHDYNVPNYPDDIAAMHEAVASIREKPNGEKFFRDFCETLQALCGGTNEAITAKADKWAEAFYVAHTVEKKKKSQAT